MMNFGLETVHIASFDGVGLAIVFFVFLGFLVFTMFFGF